MPLQVQCSVTSETMCSVSGHAGIAITVERDGYRMEAYQRQCVWTLCALSPGPQGQVM